MKNQALRLLAADIATELSKKTGESWTRRQQPDPEDERIWLDGPGGLEIRVTAGGWKQEGRLAFAGGFPRASDGGYSLPHGIRYTHITVGQERPCHQVAGEIARRLLPEYRENHALLLQRRANEQAHRDGKVALATQIHQALKGTGADLRASRYNGPTDLVYLYHRPKGADYTVLVEGRADGYGEGELKVSASSSLLLKIAALIREELTS